MTCTGTQSDPAEAAPVGSSRYTRRQAAAATAGAGRGVDDVITAAATGS